MRFGLADITDYTCLDCGVGHAHNTTHIMEHCAAHNTPRCRNNVHGVGNPWDIFTGMVVVFLQLTGLLTRQNHGVKQQ